MKNSISSFEKKKLSLCVKNFAYSISVVCVCRTFIYCFLIFSERESLHYGRFFWADESYLFVFKIPWSLIFIRSQRRTGESRNSNPWGVHQAKGEIRKSQHGGNASRNGIRVLEENTCTLGYLWEISNGQSKENRSDQFDFVIF